MITIDEKSAKLCSIALLEFYLNNKNNFPGMSEEARKISGAINEMIESRLFEKEN